MTTKYFNVKQGITTGNITLDATSGNITGVGNISVLAGGTANLGNLAIANYITGTLTTAAQPNITSLGTLTSLSITGNVTSGNANLGNLATANYFSGSGNLLSNLQAGNISGTVANANYSLYAGTVLTNAQPNITSVGTLDGLTATGTVNFTTASNVSLGAIGNVHITGGSSGYYLSTDGSGGLSFAAPPSGGGIAGSNTQVQFNDAGVFGADANFTYTKTTDTLGVVNVTMEGTGTLSGGNLVSANYITGTLTTAAQPNITSVGTLASLGVTGDVTAGNVFANSGTIGASLLTGTLTTASQPNITSVGTLSSLSVTGNVTGGNLIANSKLYSNGLVIASGGANISGNIDVTGNINVTGNLNYSNVTDLVVGDPLIYLGANNTGNLYDLGIVASYNDGTYEHTGIVRNHLDGYWTFFDGVVAEPTTVIDWANASYPTVKMGSVLTTGGANITGNANVGNLGANIGVFTGNITSQNAVLGNLATANYFTGTLTTAAQPNITSLGTLSGLTSGGTVNFTTASNVTLGAIGNVHITGGSAGYYLSTDGSGGLTFAAPPSGGGIAGSNTQVQFNDAGAFGATANFTFDKSTNTLTANYFSGNGSNLSAITGGNVTGQVGNALVAGTVYTNAQPNITSVGTLNGLSGTGTINFTSASNVSLGPVGNVHITGGSSGQYLKTDGSGGLSWGTVDTDTLANGTSNVDIATSGGNVTISVGGTSNVAVFTTSGANISTTLTVSANITSGNANLGNLVTANYFTGNGSLLTGIAAATAGTVTTNAQPNITSVGTLTSLTVSGNATIGNASITGGITSARSNVSVATNTVIDQFAPATYRTAKYVISASGDYGFQSLEVLLVQDDINSYITIYGSISSNNSSDIVDISSNINGVSGNVSVYATATSPNTLVNLSAIYLLT